MVSPYQQGGNGSSPTYNRLCSYTKWNKCTNRSMGNSAGGPDDLPVEAVKILGSYSVDHVTVTATTNFVMQDRMPRDLRKKTID